MTASAIKALVERGLRYGYFHDGQGGAGRAWAHCPKCRQRVETHVVVAEKGFATIKEYLRDHLEDCIEETR